MMTPFLQIVAIGAPMFAVGALTGLGWSFTLFSALTVTLTHKHAETTWLVVRRLAAAIVTRAVCWGVNAVAAVIVVVGWHATDPTSCAAFLNDSAQIHLAPPPQCVNAAMSIPGNARGYWVAAFAFLTLALSVSIGYWRLRGGVRAVLKTGEVPS
jgi:hypothetical protein